MVPLDREDSPFISIFFISSEDAKKDRSEKRNSAANLNMLILEMGIISYYTLQNDRGIFFTLLKEFQSRTK